MKKQYMHINNILQQLHIRVDLKLHVGGHKIDPSPDQVLNVAFRVRSFNWHSTSAPARLGLLEVKLDNFLDSLTAVPYEDFSRNTLDLMYTLRYSHVCSTHVRYDRNSYYGTTR